MTKKPDRKKILVIKLGALGDFIQALGPMAAIRRHHPDAHITLLTTAPFQKFAQECGRFDDIWLDDRPRWHQPAQWLQLRKRLNDGGFERVYDLQNSDRTSFYLRLFSPKPEWVGAARGASHRNASSERTAGHAFDGHVQTLKLAGIENVQIDDLSWMKADLSAFALKRPYVLLVTGCSPQHPQKRWPLEHYGETAKRLAAQNLQPVLIGAESETDINAAIAGSCSETLDLTGKTSLFQIAALARDAAAAIGNDTGPMHLIAATHCPSLVLFSGHSNPARHAPKGHNVSVIQEEPLSALTPQDVLDSLILKDGLEKETATLH